MSRGILLLTGQNHILNVLFKLTPVQDYYLALMTNLVNPGVNDQIGTGITEVTGAGYSRILLTRDVDWIVAGPLAESIVKIFNVGPGGWLNCNGFMICLSPVGNDAILAQKFPADMQGNYDESDEIEVNVDIQLLDYTQQCTDPVPEPPEADFEWRDHDWQEHDDPRGDAFHNEPLYIPAPGVAPVAEFDWRDHDYIQHDDPRGDAYHNDPLYIPPPN